MAYNASAYGPWVGGDDWRAWVGITKTSDTATACTIKVECWVWSQYGTTSGYNNIRGCVYQGSWSSYGSNTSISTNSWKKLYEQSYTITKTTSSQTITCKAYAEGTSGVYSGSSSTASVNVTVSAKTSYTISYNANGRGTAPSSQTKYYGTNIALRGAISATGYTFKGWNTKANGSGTSYAASATYSANAAATLYAQWQAVTYAVTYNANGGSGAPATGYKTYGANYTISTTRPQRTGYTFLGWGTSASATTASYQPGATYSTNAALALYAVWQLSYAAPTITGLNAKRCDSQGVDDEDGTYALLSFHWEVDPSDGGEVDTITVRTRPKGGNWSTGTISAGGTTSGDVSAVLGDGTTFATSTAYDIQVEVTDLRGMKATATTYVSPSYFTLDFLAGGTGIAMGKAATRDGLDVAMPAYFSDDIEAADVTVNDLHVNGSTTHSDQVKFASGTALPSAGTSTDFFATGINAFANGGRLAYKGLADMKTWLGLGATTNWAYINGNASSASYVRWRAVNGVVFVQVNMQANSFGTVTNPSTKSIATVPSGYRPSKQVSTSATANTNNVVSLWVKTDGTVNLGPLGGSINSCYGHITYPLG